MSGLTTIVVAIFVTAEFTGCKKEQVMIEAARVGAEDEFFQKGKALLGEIGGIVQQGLPENDSARRIAKAREAFSSFEKSLAALPVTARPLQRASILKMMGFAKFLERSDLYVHDQVSLEYQTGLRYIQEALALLDRQGAKAEMAGICLETADRLNMIFWVNFITPAQTEVLSLQAGLLTRAVAAYKALQQPKEELSALRRFHDKTIPQLERIIELTRAVEGPESLSLAEDYRMLGDRYMPMETGRTISYYEAARKVYSNHPEKQHEMAETLLSLGFFRQKEGRRDEAISWFEKALTIYQRMQNHDRIAYTASSLGALHYEKGEFPTSLAHFRTALTSGKLASPRSEGEAAIGLAMTLFHEGKAEEALALLENGRVYSWAILASEFNKYFIDAKPDGIRKLAIRMFEEAGDLESARAVEDSW